MDCLRSQAEYPGSPKNVQISFLTFLAISEIWKALESELFQNMLPIEIRAAFEHVRQELANKKSKMRNRQAYTAITHAHKDDKQAALENYIFTKQMGALLEGHHGDA